MKDSEDILLEKFFRRHFRNVSERLGEDKAKIYAKAVDSRLQSVLWIAGMSFLILFSISVLDILKEEILITLVSAGGIIIVYSICHLFSIRRVGEETMWDDELSNLWRKISASVSGLGVLSGSLCFYVMFGIYNFTIVFNLDDFRTYHVKYDELGIVVNVPEGWSSPHWEYKSDDGAARPVYSFCTDSENHRIWVSVHGRSTPLRYSIGDFEQNFKMYSGGYLDGGYVERPHSEVIGDKKVLKSIGRRADSPDYIYAIYQALHCGTMIYYTYSFHQNLPLEEEMAKADNFFEQIEFTDVDNTEILGKEDKRPDDYVIGDMSVDIQSAGMKIYLPCDEDDVTWDKKTRSRYVFDVPSCGGYIVRFDIQVVYTSENARVREYEADFVETMKAKLDAGWLSGPGVINVNGTEALYVAGFRKSAPGDCYIRYEFIHKGARLCVETTVPETAGVDAQIEHIESIVKNVDFY